MSHGVKKMTYKQKETMKGEGDKVTIKGTWGDLKCL
jgi:hypothetical protein